MNQVKNCPVTYAALGFSIAALAGPVLADEPAEPPKETLRLEVKAALAPADDDADEAAESVGAAVVAEIIAGALKTEILKQGLDAGARPNKVVALKNADDAASGQSDQT